MNDGLFELQMQREITCWGFKWSLWWMVLINVFQEFPSCLFLKTTQFIQHILSFIVIILVIIINNIINDSNLEFCKDRFLPLAVFGVFILHGGPLVMLSELDCFFKPSLFRQYQNINRIGKERTRFKEICGKVARLHGHGNIVSIAIILVSLLTIFEYFAIQPSYPRQGYCFQFQTYNQH